MSHGQSSRPPSARWQRCTAGSPAYGMLAASAPARYRRRPGNSTRLAKGWPPSNCAATSPRRTATGCGTTPSARSSPGGSTSPRRDANREQPEIPTRPAVARPSLFLETFQRPAGAVGPRLPRLNSVNPGTQQGTRPAASRRAHQPNSSVANSPGAWLIFAVELKTPGHHRELPDERPLYGGAPGGDSLRVRRDRIEVGDRRLDACGPAARRSATTADRSASAQCTAVLRPSAPAPTTTTLASTRSVCRSLLTDGPPQG